FRTGACSLRKTSGAFAQSSRIVGDIFWSQAVDGQVAFQCRYRQSSRFWLAVSWILEVLSRSSSVSCDIFEL
ncbi:hypothetical protein PMAYCL1PPCAC_24734, partial [Pristionchus mayeri]